MKRLRADELVPGMVTAEDLYNFNSQLIFPKGFILTERAISRLAFYAITAVRVEDDIVHLPDIVTTDIAKTASHSETVLNSQEFKEFKKQFDTEVDNFKERINMIISQNAPIEVETLLDGAFSLVETGKKSFGIFDLLLNMRTSDDETYAHCMNVSLICNVAASWLDMSEEEIRMATLCGLFHDVGKLKIPDIILRKKGILTANERKIVQTHALEGYNMLKDMNLDIHVKNAALMHHERCDGSGYPFGTTAENIDPYAKLVAVADVYDAMTSARSYRKALSPFKAIATMEEEGLQKFDAKFVLTFLRNVVNTYINNRVLLSNGQEGEIIFVHKDSLSRPTIKCNDTYIDLSAQKTLEVVDII